MVWEVVFEMAIDDVEELLEDVDNEVEEVFDVAFEVDEELVKVLWDIRLPYVISIVSATSTHLFALTLRTMVKVLAFPVRLLTM